MTYMFHGMLNPAQLKTHAGCMLNQHITTGSAVHADVGMASMTWTDEHLINVGVVSTLSHSVNLVILCYQNS